MEKTFINNECCIEITTENKTNGISCVANIKTFVKPSKGSNAKANRKRVDDIESYCREVVSGFVKSSDIMSNNHIFDFECTRNNLNVHKWSRVKVDLYLFTPFVEQEDELLEETTKLCKMTSNILWIMFRGTEEFDIINEVE